MLWTTIKTTFLTGLPGSKKASITWYYCSVKSSTFFHFPLEFQEYWSYASFCPHYAFSHCWRILEDVKANSKEQKGGSLCTATTPSICVRLISGGRPKASGIVHPTRPLAHRCMRRRDFGKWINSSFNHTVTWEACQGAPFYDVLMRWNLKWNSA